ncbi:MAG: agmatine deiminase family protein, partial [Deltaproteobacteria bacterium]|nr:agmatine deiminase family protein [Deltaproteobacteria bacterium]
LATYLVWPHNLDTWPGKFELVPPIFALIAAALAHFEPVRILVRDAARIADVREMIAAVSAPDGGPVRMSRIDFLPIATNDSWIRDYGPIFLNRIAPSEDGPMQIAMDWRFNSWGGKYGACNLDDAVPQRLAEYYGFEVVETGMVLEGGSLDVNGGGLLLTTEACLLNKNRNPSMNREEIEEHLRVYLGVERILWLGEGIAGDDTDGHVDDLARFIAANIIVTVVEQDTVDVNYKLLQDNLQRLHAMRNRRGEPFTIATLPMPAPLYFDGVRLPASYANFYITNGGVLMPSFGCAADQVAQATLARLFPDRRVVAIPSGDLVWGLGAIHCLTQQHPAPPRIGS